MYNGLRYSLVISFIFSFGITSAQIGGQQGGMNRMMSQQGTSGAELNRPREYELAGITVSGAKFLDADLLISVTNLSVGQQLLLPNDEHIARAIKALDRKSVV